MKAMHLLGEMEISTDLVSEDILTYE
jgi:hypothetical protein